MILSRNSPLHLYGIYIRKFVFFYILTVYKHYFTKIFNFLPFCLVALYMYLMWWKICCSVNRIKDDTICTGILSIFPISQIFSNQEVFFTALVSLTMYIKIVQVWYMLTFWFGQSLLWVWFGKVNWKVNCHIKSVHNKCHQNLSQLKLGDKPLKVHQPTLCKPKCISTNNYCIAAGKVSWVLILVTSQARPS